MKLRDVLNVFRDDTYIYLYVGSVKSFVGHINEALEEDQFDNVGMYLDCDIVKMQVGNYRLFITI